MRCFTKDKKRLPLALILVFLAFAGTALAGTALAQPPVPAADLRADGVGFENVVDPARELFENGALWRALEAPGTSLEKTLDDPITLEHEVPLGDGEWLYVTETFTLRSWLRWPHRAVLFLCGSAFNADHFLVPFEGYDAAAMAAERGFFAYSVDYLGVRNSFKPADGRDADFEANTEAMATLLRYIRFFRAVPKVDLVGEGYGGSIATQLAADASRVKSVSMSAMLYKEVVGGPLTDPGFVAFLESSPDGYFFGPGEGSTIFLVGTPQEVVDFVVATQGGFYPVPNFLVATNLPFFDPGLARAPGLVIRGSEEALAGPTDHLDLAADYGTSGASLVVIDGAGHAPRLEGPAVADAFWQATFDFIDP